MFLSRRDNGVYYLFFFDEAGNRRKVSTKARRKPEALLFLSNWKDEQVRVKNICVQKSLQQFLTEYSKYSCGVHGKNSYKSTQSILRQSLRFFGNVPLQQITVRQIEQLLAFKKTTTSEHTVRTYFATLRSFFNTAVRWKYLRTNPCKEVEKPKVREIQPPHFSKDEFAKVLKHIKHEEIRELCLASLYSAMRLSEILNLCWSNVDFENRLIHIQNSDTFSTKSRKNRTIPISDQLCDLLTARKHKARFEFVFPNRHGVRQNRNYCSAYFKQCVRDAGVNPKLHWHSIRHTAATWLVQSGVSIFSVQKILGHAQISTTQIYSHLQPSDLHNTVNLITLDK